MRITNRDYQRLNHVDSVTANRELRGLVQPGLIELNSTRRCAYYTLKIPSEEELKENFRDLDTDFMSNETPYISKFDKEGNILVKRLRGEILTI